MSRSHSSIASALAITAGLGLAAPAWADLSPEALWQMAQEAVAGGGGRLTAQDSRRGDALILTRGQIDLDGGAVLLLPDITLRATPQGGVQVEVPARFPLTLDLPPAPTDPDKVTLTVSAPDLRLVLNSLDAMAVDLDLSATSITASLDPLVMPPGSNAGPSDFFVALAVADLAVTHRHNLAPTDAFADTKLALGTVHAEMRIDIPSEKTKGSLALDLSDLAGHLKGHVPPEAEAVFAASEQGNSPDFAAFLDLLDAGLGLDAALSHGAVSLAFDAPLEVGGPNALSISAASGSTAVSVDRQGILYEASSGPSRVYYRGTDPEIPLPELELSIDDYRAMLKWGFPGGGTWGSAAGQANSGAAGNGGPPGSGDWGLAYRIGGLAVSPQLWDMFDPGRVIPRDPMTIGVEMSGLYALDPKALQPGWTSTPESPPPFTEITLALTDLVLAGAGASLTGKGDVALDFTAMTTVNDQPKAKGTLSFVTLGANALLDRMGTLGLLSAEELQSARLGLLFIGRIEGGADRLVTELGFDGDQVVLNGQRIK